MKIDEEIVKRGLQYFVSFYVSDKQIDNILENIKYSQKMHDEYISLQSAKPGQASYPASPCPADTLNTPPNSRHPGAKDCEVDHSCNGCGRKQCHLQKEKDNMIEGLTITSCSEWIDKHKLSEELE